MDNRIIQAVGEHIVAQGALAGGDQGIGVNESAQVGVVITGLEVVKAGLGVLGLTAIPIAYSLYPYET